MFKNVTEEQSAVLLICYHGTRSTGLLSESYKFNSYIGGSRIRSKGLFCFNWLSQNMPEDPHNSSHTGVTYKPRQTCCFNASLNLSILECRPSPFKEEIKFCTQGPHLRRLWIWTPLFLYPPHHRNRSWEILRDGNNISRGTSVGRDCSV